MTIGSKPSIQSAWKLFEKVETELGLSEWELSGVRVWKLIRFEMFNYFLGQIGLGSGGIRRRKPNWSRIIFYPLNFVFANPFFPGKNGGFRVVLSHEREHLVNGIISDPITSRAVDGTSGSDTLTLFTSPGSFSHYRSGQKSNSVPTEIGNLYSLFLRVHWGPEDDNRMSLLVEKLFSCDPTDSSCKNYFRTIKTTAIKRARRFKGQRAVFRRLFLKLQTSYLYLAVSYSREAVIDAARSIGARSIEFQHGYAGIGHPGYDFIEWHTVPYFPDHWLGWGPAWTKGLDISKRTDVHFIGSPMITELSEQSKSIEKTPKSLLVLSQGETSHELIVCALEFAKSMTDWKVAMKLHPSESVKKFHSSELSKRAKPVGVKIFEDDLHSLLQKHEVVVGEYSTALVEASASGCKVGVFTRFEHPFSQRLVEDGLGLSFKDFGDLKQVVSDLKTNEAAQDFFSYPVHNVIELVEQPDLQPGMNLP